MITKYEKFLESSNDDKYIVRIIKYGKKNYVSRLNKHHSDGYDVVVTSKNPFSDPDVLKMSKETALDIVGKSKGTKAINIKGQIIIEGVTPKTEVQDEIDRLMDKGLENLTPEEKEFLNNPYKPKETEKDTNEILKYYQIAENFFRSIIGVDVRNFDLNDKIDLFDVLHSEEEVYHVGNVIYYKYGIQIDPDNNNDFKLVNIFRKIAEKSK